MDQIEDCFAKYFLTQAMEIEPETIQALINEGYRSKLSLLAMDLIHDLPLLSTITLAQRSLIRRYIGALQENQPLTLQLSYDPLSPLSSVPKKRKYDVYVAEESRSNRSTLPKTQLSDSETASLQSRNSGSSVSPPSIASPVTMIGGKRSVRALVEASAVRDSSSPDFSETLMPTSRKPRGRPVKEPMVGGWSCEASGSQINSSMAIEDPVETITSGRRRGRPARSSPASATLSQIRFHEQRMQKQEVNDISMLDPSPNDSLVAGSGDLNFSVNISPNETGNKTRGRSSRGSAVVRTLSQIRYHERMQRQKAEEEEDQSTNKTLNDSINVSRRSNAVSRRQSTNPTAAAAAATPEPEPPVLTPAQRAIKAKIEAKKQQNGTGKGKRTTSRRKG